MQLSWLRGFAGDLRVAVRLIVRQPGFACIAMLTLALGIGANTAVFSLLDAVLLRPLPFPQPDRLVRVDATKDGKPIFDPSALDVRDYARENQTFESLVAYSLWRKTVSLSSSDSEPQQQSIGLVPPPTSRPSASGRVAGVAMGLIGAWAARQTLAQLVFGVSTLDATTYLAGAVLLLIVALAASLIPARRALRIDPMSALRGD